MGGVDAAGGAPRRLRRAEAVLARRTSRVVLLLEQAWNDDNVQAVLRTAESFGVQHVWSVRHPHGRARVRRAVTRGSEQWLTLREFERTRDCVAALRAGGWALWVSELGPSAEPLASPAPLRPVPARIALAVGREVGGVSAELLAAAERRLYLPMHGFTESYNLSVATGLLLQRLFDAEPGLRGSMGEDERSALRARWYRQLAGDDPGKQELYLSWLAAPPPPLEDSRPDPLHRQPRIKGRVLAREGTDPDEDEG